MLMKLSQELPASRENYQRLIKDIEAGSLSAVWVIAADRYGRNVEESSRFKSLLLRHRIRLFIKDSEVNLLSPDGRFSQNVRDAVSEFEKDLIRDRTLNSRRTNVNNGHKRTHSIYGYDDFYDSQGSHKLRINEAEAKVVRHIFRLYKRGKSFKKIARALNDEGIPTKFKGKIVKDRITKQPRVINTKWSHSHISYIIRRPEYARFPVGLGTQKPHSCFGHSGNPRHTASRMVGNGFKDKHPSRREKPKRIQIR